MTDCIKGTPGTIGYIDSGHGISAGLSEIEIENLDGTLLSSQQAAANGGIVAAAINAFPASADADFSGVALLNKPGENTWPIVVMTYIYLRKNLTYVEYPDESTLLVAFVKSLYDPEYIQQCVEKYGFILPPNATRDMALAGIEMLEVHPDAEEWIFESSTLPIAGADHNVISSKRSRIADVERHALESEFKAMVEENAILRDQMSSMTKSESASVSGLTSSQETQLRAALVLSILSFVLCFVIIIMFSSSNKQGA